LKYSTNSGGGSSSPRGVDIGQNRPRKEIAHKEKLNLWAEPIEYEKGRAKAVLSDFLCR